MAIKAIDLSGQTFGFLQVIRKINNPNPLKNKGAVYWECRCLKCQNVISLMTRSLINKKNTTCGCDRENLSGQIFGHLKAVERVDKISNRGWRVIYYRCQCLFGGVNCINEITILAQDLKSRHTSSCGCKKNKHPNLTGTIFGHIKVLEKVDKPEYLGAGGSNYYQCQCLFDGLECKKFIIESTQHLIEGSVKSCGCQNKIQTAEEAKNRTAASVFSRYRDGNLIFEDFLILTQLPCHYCGLLAGQSNCHNVHTVNGGNTKFAINHGIFHYNGLDRVNNNLPHDLENVVPCCRTCNRFKSDRTVQDFLNIISNLNTEIILKPKIITLNQNVKINEMFPFEKKNGCNKLITKIKGIKQNAKNRNLVFNINPHQCAEIMILSCSYCNKPAVPEQGIFNGLDRIDNNQGYEIGNFIPACFECNRARWHLTISEFKIWISRIKTFQINNISIFT